jgi:hypothetical protein
MLRITHAPAFVSFTGVDRASLLPELEMLSSMYPIEWGILIDPAREGQPLFPTDEVREEIGRAGLRLSAHICGEPARLIADGHDPALNLAGFSRAQINHSRSGSGAAAIANVARYGALAGVRPGLQCQGAFPEVTGIDWLYDVSFGTGAKPVSWPDLMSAQTFCGFSGGLTPNNVQNVLAQLRVAPGVPYWIDIESGVRSSGSFDIDKCAKVCELVFGPPRILTVHARRLP